MNPARILLIVIATVGASPLLSRPLAAEVTPQPDAAGLPPAATSEVRKDLVEARDAVWRAFFDEDTARLESLLGPELIAVQEFQEKWERRESMIAIAREIKRAGVKLLRLEFPQTEIQVFGDTAILYYTYIFSTGRNGKPDGVDAGRGTEVFVKRGGKWVDVGWHLDNGPFTFENGGWRRLGVYPPPDKG